MGKGRRSKARVIPNASAELAMIERAERDVQRRTAQMYLAKQSEQIRKHCEAGTERQKTLIISGGDGTKIVYTKADRIPEFSVKDLFQSIGIEGINMSSDLNPGVTMEIMALKLSENIDERDPKFRMYMRDSINYSNFAMLQHLVETMYLPRPLEELQGWIMHYGSIFVMGGVDFNLKDSIERCKEAIRCVEETWPCTLTASAPLFTTPDATY